jgi:hypothetical protein
MYETSGSSVGWGIAMDQIVIDGIEPETVTALSKQARENGHTLDEEIKSILRQAALRRDPIAWSRAIRAMTPKGIPQTDSTKIIRESRDHDH